MPWVRGGSSCGAGQHLYLVMVSSFKLIHSLASLKYAKVRAVLQLQKQKPLGEPPRASRGGGGRARARGGSSLQADNGDGGVALRLLSAQRSRRMGQPKGAWMAGEEMGKGREVARGLCHPRRLHANWLKCEFM